MGLDVGVLMDVNNNKCPSCGKRGGLKATGPDFDHRIHGVSSPDHPLAKLAQQIEAHYKRPNVRAAHDLAKMPELSFRYEENGDGTKTLIVRGHGSCCTKCGWSQVDRTSVHYDATCAGCAIALGTHSHDDDKDQKAHYCWTCSKTRVAFGAHDPDDAVVTFPVKCAGGCGKFQGHISYREGTFTDLPPILTEVMICNDCRAKRGR